MSPPINSVDLQGGRALHDFERVAGLGTMLAEISSEARQAVRRLGDRRVWMISGDDARGVLVENLHALSSMMRSVGIDAHWLRLSPASSEQALLHRRLLRLMLGDHDVGAAFDDEEATSFRLAGERAADTLAPQIDRRDLIIAHGVGVAAVGAVLKQRLGLHAIWRNTIGLDERTPATRAAWRFLKPHLTPYDRGLFTCAEYIPQYFTHRASLLPPSIDPLSDKNRGLSLHRVIGTLRAAGLTDSEHPSLAEPFSARALRLTAHGELEPAGDLGLVYRPVVLQVSGWDRLNGMGPLLEAFAQLKRDLARGGLHQHNDRQRRRIEIARLVLAGPHPDEVAALHDQQTGFVDLSDIYADLEPEIAADICILALPTQPAREHALTVNALQRVASVIVQNSLAEGFGLAVTEAAYKRVPILASATSGIRLQIRHGIDGRLCQAPDDPRRVAKSLQYLLGDDKGRPAYALSAHRRVRREFILPVEFGRLMRLLTEWV